MQHVRRAEQSFIWTALPNGFVDDQLRVSVLVSPKLYVAWLTDDLLHWTQTVRRQLRFHLEVRHADGPDQPVVFSEELSGKFRLQRLTAAPDDEFWQAVFDTKTPVQPAVHDWERKAPDYKSYSASELYDATRDLYVRYAASEALPPAARHDARREALAAYAAHRAGRELLAFVDPRAPRGPFTPDSRSDAPGVACSPDPAGGENLVLAAYAPDPADLPPTQPLDPTARQEFHRALSSLAEYPSVLRRLGIVVDLLLPRGAMVDRSDRFRMTAFVTRPGGRVPTDFPNLSVPATHRFWPVEVAVDRAAKLFHVADDASGTWERGMLNLRSQHYRVIQADLEASVIKNRNYAAHRDLALENEGDITAAERIVRKGTPTIRSIGLSIAEEDVAGRIFRPAVVRGNALRRELNEAEQNGQLAVDDQLTASELYGRIRLDVWDQATGRWYPLNDRHGTYAYRHKDARREFSVRDEGSISRQVTRVVCDDAALPETRTNPVLARWQGWGLSIPRPGYCPSSWEDPGRVAERRRGGHPPLTETCCDPACAIHGMDFERGLRLEARFEDVRGSLAILRFGALYAFRARAVDLAGNSHAPEIWKTQPPDDNCGFPSTPPVKYFRFEPAPWPLVLPRQRLGAELSPGETVERLVIRSNVGQPADNVTERHLAPASTTPPLAEAHGMFDVLDPDDIYELLKTRQDPPDQPSYDVDRFRVDYLPDPLCHTACIEGLRRPGFPQLVWAGHSFNNKLLQRRFEGQWPQLSGFRLRLSHPPTSGVLPPDPPGVLTIYLPPAAVLRLNVRACLGQKDLDLLGVYDWVRTDRMGDHDPQAVERRHQLLEFATEGAMGLLAPEREIVLVHAVRQPLEAPSFEELEPALDKHGQSRRLGETYQDFDADLVYEATSTGKVEVTAHWREAIDDVAEPAPRETPAQAHLFEKADLEDPCDCIPGQLVRAHIQLAPCSKERLRHQFSDTKRRTVRYVAVATTRFLDYLDPGEVAEGQPITRRSDEKYCEEFTIPSSARPEPPKVLYVIPTFGWGDKEQGDTETRRTRHGGGVRVYLDRPWYSSGEGELLGVVFASSPFEEIEREPAPGQVNKLHALSKRVTQWGFDPIWRHQGCYGYPTGVATDASFPTAKLIQHDLTLAELFHTDPVSGGSTYDEALKVSVAAYEVHFDAKRKLWYADIEINTGSSYYPFARLALVRYQPESVTSAIAPFESCHLSTVVQADFAQLTPTRTASATFTGDQAVIRVAGPSYEPVRDVTGARSRSEIWVTVQSRSAAHRRTNLGWATLDLVKLTPGLPDEKGGNWTGSIPLPVAARSDRQLRFVFREYEAHAADPERDADPLTGRTIRRLVYLDMLVVDPTQPQN